MTQQGLNPWGDTLSKEDPKDKNEKTAIVITEKFEFAKTTQNYEPFLIHISGRETGRMHQIMGKSSKIGRDASCQIVVDDPHVSRIHAEFIRRGDKDLIVRDLDSLNGVRVNGIPVKEQALNDGDKIQIGSRLSFKFRFQDAEDQNYHQNLFLAANLDGLTQLYNKSYFIDALSKEFSFSRRNRQPLSLIMFDIDYFKKINDTFGHMAGDLVLKTIGSLITKSVRLENIACRYGGEEFAIVLRQVNGELAHMIAERLRKQIENEKIAFRGKPIQVTISLGIATYESGNFDTIEDFIQCADENLYSAKELGRNRTILKRSA